jgi:hypothetical protein
MFVLLRRLFGPAPQQPEEVFIENPLEPSASRDSADSDGPEAPERLQVRDCRCLSVHLTTLLDSSPAPAWTRRSSQCRPTSRT